jgi:GNAT superfamily N-acetyltransferase
MRVTRHADAASFLAEADAFLVANEATHNLPLAVARNCVADRSRYKGPNYFAVVEDGGRVVGVGVMTPPFGLQIYAPPGLAAEAVADDLASSEWNPPWVHGPDAASEAFAAAWCARRGLRTMPGMRQRAFALTAVTPAPPARGRMRVAEDADVALAGAWYRAFYGEADIHSGGLPPEEVARRSVADGRVFLWDDAGPVAQTVIVGTTPNGARIGAVYTPPENRRRGYATALVEAVSRRALADGKKFCFLFTDLSNPVSNSIYPKVGYRPVGDYCDIEFVS